MYTPFVLYIKRKCNNRDANRSTLSADKAAGADDVLPPKDFWYKGCFEEKIDIIGRNFVTKYTLP